MLDGVLRLAFAVFRGKLRYIDMNLVSRRHLRPSVFTRLLRSIRVERFALQMLIYVFATRLGHDCIAPNWMRSLTCCRLHAWSDISALLRRNLANRMYAWQEPHAEDFRETRSSLEVAFLFYFGASFGRLRPQRGNDRLYVAALSPQRLFSKVEVHVPHISFGSSETQPGRRQARP